MAEPIANDWKAIHDRMEQIKAEKFAPIRRCQKCDDHGWIPEYPRARYACSLRVCDLCLNPERRPPPWQMIKD
jgi:hypothetical protein